jgi:hypothetical protein
MEVLLANAIPWSQGKGLEGGFVVILVKGIIQPTLRYE